MHAGKVTLGIATMVLLAGAARPQIVLPDSVWAFKDAGGSLPWASTDGTGNWTITSEPCVINLDTLDGAACKNAKIKYKAGAQDKYDLLKIQFDNVWADSLDSIVVRFFDTRNRAGTGALYCVPYDTNGTSVMLGESLFVANYTVTTSSLEWIGPFKLPDSLLTLVSGPEFQGKPFALRLYAGSTSTEEIRVAELETQLFFKPPAVNNPPVLAPIGPQSTPEGVNLTFGVSATDDESIPSLTTSTLPTGAVFVDSGNGAGSFDWTPDFTQSGTYNVTFYATDDSAAVDSEIVTITVTES
ncbi:MAG: Ig domain-containing protein, partial [Candidatus Zixiibacteriota bacterium]